MNGAAERTGAPDPVAAPGRQFGIPTPTRNLMGPPGVELGTNGSCGQASTLAAAKKLKCRSRSELGRSRSTQSMARARVLQDSRIVSPSPKQRSAID